MSDEDDDFPSKEDLKRKPVYTQVPLESGHPQITIENLSTKLEDLGYKVSYPNPEVTKDNVADGVSDFVAKMEAKRSEEQSRKNAKELRKYA
jgi:hypothetical protein